MPFPLRSTRGGLFGADCKKGKLGYGAPFLIECAHGDARLAESDAARVCSVERKKNGGGDGDGRTGEMVMVVRRSWAPGSSSQPAQRCSPL